MKQSKLLSSSEFLGGKDIAALLLRIAGGAFMLTHGIGKFLKLFGDDPIQFASAFGLGATFTLALAAFAEVFCAVLLVLGITTRYALIPLIITMVYAAFVAHGDHPFAKKELSLLYLIIYMAIFFIGAGKYSIDRLIKK